MTATRTKAGYVVVHAPPTPAPHKACVANDGFHDYSDCTVSVIDTVTDTVTAHRRGG